MKILIIGSGGREHALAWALARSPRATRVYVAPGNGGTEWAGGDGLAPATNVSISADDCRALIAFARDNGVGLAVVGPEAPLADGLVDAFASAGLAAFGPSQAAAQLEASKAFAKDFMAAHGIPTATYAAFDDYEEARDFVVGSKGQGAGGYVIKASGLAAGKGVVVCDDLSEAEAALERIMVRREFGTAGDTVVIEERLDGPELSVMAFSDGQHLALMPPARDHKRVYDGDQGPNTGGMGACAPVPDVDGSFLDEVRRTILEPVVQGMAERGTPYVGVLYAGLMLTPAGPKVLEFNCRFGDPETQVILPLMESDLVDIMEGSVAGRLDETEVRWRPEACATVVMAAPGYPGSYPKGMPINGIVDANGLDGTIVFHAGTTRQNGQLVTAGGRVLAVSALGQELPVALRRAYQGAERISFDGAHYRRDIGRGT